MNAIVSPLKTSEDDQRSSVMLDEYLLPLRAYLDDESLTEICINRPGEVWTENHQGWKCHKVSALTYFHCYQLATLIAHFNQKAISMDNPILTASLPTGERAHVVMPPACEPHTISITIRKPSVIEKTLEQLEGEGSFAECEDVASSLLLVEHELLKLKKEKRIKEFLELAVRSKRNILVVGETGSGKTTIAKSLILKIPEYERLITIEDVHELFMFLHLNKVHLFFAQDNEAGAKVTAKQALESCLRMYPGRVLFGELRDGEAAWEFLKLANTNHPGSITTMHANGAYEAFEQLTALIKDSRAGAYLEARYIKHRVLTTIDVVLFYNKRKLREIYYDPEHKRQQMAGV